MAEILLQLGPVVILEPNRPLGRSVRSTGQRQDNGRLSLNSLQGRPVNVVSGVALKESKAKVCFVLVTGAINNLV